MFFKNKFGYTDILYFMRFFGNIADNGKSIGEVRAFEELKVQENPNVADAFFGLLNYKKYQYEKAAAAKNDKIFNYHFPPHFANTMLSAGVFVFKNVFWVLYSWLLYPNFCKFRCFLRHNAKFFL